MNRVVDLHSILDLLKVKYFTIVGNKVIIRDNVVIDHSSVLDILNNSPYKFIFNESLITIQVLPNFTIKGDVKLLHQEGFDIKYIINSPDHVYSDFKDFNLDINAEIKAKSLDLKNYCVNSKIEADTMLYLRQCILNTKTIVCPNSIDLEHIEFISDLLIEKCKDLYIHSEYTLSNDLLLKDITNLSLNLGNDHYVGSLYLDNVETLSLENYSNLFYLKEPIRVETFYIPDYYDVENIRDFLGHRIPDKPMISCDTLKVSHKVYTDSYPEISDIEKYVQLNYAI